MANATKEAKVETEAKDDDQIVEETKVTEEDLRKAKEESESEEVVENESSDETSEETTESEDSQAESQESDEETKETESFTKKFPNLKGDDWEAYAKELEVAYDNSFKEVRRLKEQTATNSGAEDVDGIDAHPAVQYARRQMEQEAQKAFDTISQKYPQINDLDTFEKFRKTVEGVSNAILAAEGRQPTFLEAYEKSALVLGWGSEDNSQAEKLGAAVKEGAASTKTNSSTKQAKPSKVSEAMIQANMKMYPNKTRQEIIEELEPYTH